VLPVIVLVPLLAGEILHQRLGTLAPSRFPNLLLGAAAALIAGFHAYAWWFNASESAGAPHTIRFYEHALWSPPLGWWPWIALASLGAIGLLAFAVIETFSDHHEHQRAPLAPGLA
jgi:hypothetical protein